MLIKCLECQLQVSDKAVMCPHCGYPLKPNAKIYRSKPKRKRLPNGFGQITEIKNQNLRKPFRVMVPSGKNENGRPIVKMLKPIAYFETYNDAYAALLEYNRNPYDCSEDITFKELYEKWSEQYYKTITETSRDSYKTSFKYCSDIYDMKVREIKIRHLKHCLEEGSILHFGKKMTPSPNRQQYIKFLMNMLFDYAVEYEIVDKNIARMFKISSNNAYKENDNHAIHTIYTDDEINTLWQNAGLSQIADMVLIQCYSGWRPNELINLKLSDIDLENHIFSGGSKTKAGKQRVVPIHNKIYDLVVTHYNISAEEGNPYLFRYKDRNYKYQTFTVRLSKLLNELNINPDHKAHDGRKHFVTLAKKYKVDEYAIKRMVGHSISDLTENTYTERSHEWLKEEIDKIK